MIFLFVVISSNAVTLQNIISKFDARTGETDTSESFYSRSMAITWFNLAQQKISTLSGFLKYKTDIVYGADTAYPLPADFISKRGDVLGYSLSYERWTVLFENYQFKLDTNVFQYYIEWHHPDSAFIYFKNPVGSNEIEIDDTVRIYYDARTTDLSSLTDTINIPGQLEPFIIEEMLAYYEQAMKNYQALQLIWQMARTDMGFKLGK
jgi:hypothetical protein